MVSKTFTSQSEVETKKIAAQIFAELKGGTVVGLKGDLGAGKTLFVKGVMESVGYTDAVQSPTFVIRNDYDVMHDDIESIIHIDLYRLDQVTKENDEFLEGVGEADTITFIEWPERLTSEYQKKMVMITIDIAKDDTRTITLS